MTSGAKGSVRGHLILAEVVRDALKKHKQGELTDYYAIIEHLAVAQMKPVLMQRWLQGLSLCVSKLTKNHDKLVGSTLKFTWYDKDPKTADFYIEYLTSLLSAQAHYLHAILSNLTQHLWVEHGTAPGEGGDGKVMGNLHRAIQAVLDQTPLASSLLMRLITKNYPFRGKSVFVQELSLRNVLYVSIYCPTLREDILRLVVHKMLSIDVELPNLEDEEEDEESQFQVELDAGEGEGGGGGEEEEALLLGPHYSQKQVMRNEPAEKLDVMMTICLQHFHRICHHKGSLDSDEAWSLLHSLLRIFEHVVLPTHACSHVQFLVFQVTSLHLDFPGYLLDFLWKKFKDPNVAAILRQSTAAYIASYVARSKSVSLATAKLCITIVMQWIHLYLDNSSGNLKPDIKQHGPFYSLCQAAFYIFTFRSKSLIEMEGGIEFLRQLNFERVITSRLNPLKMCLPTVVDMFASLANRHEVAFSYTILEQNKRLVLSTEAASGGTCQQQHNLLDCFFPFDPYQLKRSGKFFAALYQQWEEPGDAEKENREEEDVDHSSIASSMSCLEHSFSEQLISPEF